VEGRQFDAVPRKERLGTLDPGRLRKPESKPLVMRPAKHVPRRRSHLEYFRKLVVSASDGCDGMVACWEEGPPRKLFLACNPQKLFMQGLSATADRNTPACVAGSCRETLLLLPENPDRNAAAAEAASQPEAAIVATDYDRTVTCALIRAAEKLRGRWIGKG